MIRYGILGAGFVAGLHAQALATLPEAQIVGIADPDLPRAEKLGQEWGCPAFSSFSELCDKAKPEAVSICVPTFLHAEAVCEAASRGIHALCEKPLALTAEDCQRMLEAEKHSTSILSTAQVLRWWPEYRELHNQALSGAVGPVVSLTAARLLHGTRKGWFADPALGGGALFDLMAHDVDFMLWTLGNEIRSVYATGFQNEQGAWQHVWATFLYQDHRRAVVEAGNDLPAGYPFTTRLSLCGPEGGLEVSSAADKNIGVGVKTDSTLWRIAGGERTALLQSGGDAQAKAFREELAAFLQGVQMGTSPLPLKEATRTIGLLNKVRESLETEMPISVSPAPRTLL